MSDDWDSKTVIGYKRKTAKVTKKDSDLNAARRTGAVISTDKKISAGGNKVPGTDHQRIAKLDRVNEVAPPPKVAPIVGRTIQDARMELNLSQKDVAQRINEKQSVLQEYETSKAIPSTQILQKLERALGVKLRGTEIGKKLERPNKP